MRASHRLGVVLAAAVVAAGCGEDEERANRPRPPAPINVTAAIDSGQVRVSPRTFGSGPVVFIISNQSGVAQRLTLAGSIQRASGAIAARGSGRLTADPPSGRYRLARARGASSPRRCAWGRAGRRRRIGCCCRSGSLGELRLGRAAGDRTRSAAVVDFRIRRSLSSLSA